MKPCLSLFPILFAGLALSAESDFDTGLRAYETGDYSTAITSFESSLEDLESAALRHNLALAYFQNDRVTEAVWQLERSLRLAPHQDDYQFKLAALRQQLGLPPSEPHWLNRFGKAVSPRSWIIVAATAFWLLMVSVLLPWIAGKPRPLIGKALLILSSFTLLVSGSVLFYQKDLSRQGICLNASMRELHAAPAAVAPQTGIARPGERALLLERHNNYVRIRTEGGAEGWIGLESFRLIQ